MFKFKVVRILGVPYSVTFQTQKQIAHEIGAEAVGYCDDLNDKIVLASELKGKALKRIFLHEVGHAAMGVNGHNQTIDPVQAEIIVHTFANAMLELFEQKEVMSFLLKPHK